MRPRKKSLFWVIPLAITLSFLSCKNPEYKELDFTGKNHKTWYNAALMTYGKEGCTEKFGSVLNAAFHLKDANIGVTVINDTIPNRIQIRLAS